MIQKRPIALGDACRGLLGAGGWTLLLALVLFGPSNWADRFWFLRALHDAPWVGRVALLSIPWLLLVGAGRMRIVPSHPIEAVGGSLVRRAFLLTPWLATLFWIFRDRVRTTGDAGLFTWALDIGAPLRVPHGPLTQATLEAGGRLLARGLGLPLPDGVALCVALMAALCGPAMAYLLTPLDRGRRWPFVWTVAGSALIVLAFGQIEIYLLPTVLELLYLLSAFVWLETGRRWWVAPALFPLMVLSGLWTGILIPVHLWLFIRLWKERPESRGKLLSVIYLSIGFVILVCALGPGSLREAWTLLAVRLSSGEYWLVAREGAHAGLFGWSQFWGLFNVLLGIVAPVLPLLPLLRWKNKSRPVKKHSTQFLMVTSGSALLLAFLWNPWFGYERDVDLFSFLAPPLLIWIAAVFSAKGVAPLARRMWGGLFLLCALPALGQVLDHSQAWTATWWREHRAGVEAAWRPGTVAAWPRQRMVAGDFEGAVDSLNDAIRYVPHEASSLMEFLDTHNIERLAMANTHYAPPVEWARDLIVWDAPHTVLILDRWGRLFTHDGQRLQEIELLHPVPLGDAPFVAIARGVRMELLLLRADGSLLHGHQAVDEPLGAWTWRNLPPPLGIVDAWPADRATDVALDTATGEILILDRLGGVHIANGATVSVHPPPDFDEAVSFMRLEDGWAYATRRGACYALHGGLLGSQPEIVDPQRFPHPIFTDGVAEPDGRGRTLLDSQGVLHSVGEASLFRPSVPQAGEGQFCAMALDPETGEAVLLDSMYRIDRVAVDIDGVLAAFRLVDATHSNAKAALQFASRAWLKFPHLRGRLLDLIDENPALTGVAADDPLWVERMKATAEPQNPG